MVLKHNGKKRKEKRKNRRGFGKGLIDTMDFAELERIRAEKEFLEKLGKLPGQGRRTEQEDLLFFSNRAKLCLPVELR